LSDKEWGEVLALVRRLDSGAGLVALVPRTGGPAVELVFDRLRMFMRDSPPMLEWLVEQTRARPVSLMGTGRKRR
jgi:hypothetical protein